MQLIRSTLFMGLFYIWTAIICIFCSPALLMERKKLVACQTVWSHGVLFLLRKVGGIGFAVRGEENIPDGGALLAMKHQSSFDTFAMHTIVHDPAFVMKKELLKIPLYGTFCLKAGMIPIDRDAGLKSMRELMKRSSFEIFENERPVIIFPEGSRSKPGSHKPYQAGIYGMYKKVNVPVVPIALNSGVYWPGRKESAKRKGEIVFEFLPAIPTGLSKDEFLNMLQERIETASTALLPEEIQLSLPAA